MNETHAAPPRVLLVEDNPGDALLFREHLDHRARPHEVVHVECLADATAALQATAYDAVLLDLRLPDGAGVEAVKTILATAGDVPIVVLTGLDDEALALTCIRAGAQDYLSKQSVRPTDVARAIGYAMARVAERQARREAGALAHRLAAIVRGSADAIVSTTEDGTITSWNAAAIRMFGHPDAVEKGLHLDEAIRPAPGRGDEAPPAPGLPQELTRLRADGSVATFLVVSHALRDDADQVTGHAAIYHDVTGRKAMERELRDRSLQLQKLAARLNAVREDERTRISREVHDELGQLMTGLKMDLTRSRQRLEKSGAPAPEVIERLHSAEQVADHVVREVQRIALELRPSVLDSLGLSAAIRDEARRFGDRTGLATETEQRVTNEPGPAKATALFRVLQELLTNVVRHAQAQRVHVQFDDHQDGWRLVVEDDGVGLPADWGTPHLGVLGMQERLHAVGGTLTLANAPAGGTVATAWVGRERRDAT